MTTKSQRRILKAFQQLLQQKDYCTISVSEIVKAADVGKTTFYRHYQRKLDVFVAMHDAIFTSALNDFSTANDWLSIDARTSFVDITILASKKVPRRSSMAYQLGNDWPIALRRLKQNLTQMIERRLASAFGEQVWKVPLPELAASIAALMSDYFLRVNTNTLKPLNHESANANALQLFTRAIILTAADLEQS